MRRPGRGTRRCEDCARIHNEGSKDRRDSRRRQGMCPLCGARKPARGKHHCTRCLARARNNNAQFRHRGEDPVARVDTARDPITIALRRRGAG